MRSPVFTPVELTQAVKGSYISVSVRLQKSRLKKGKIGDAKHSHCRCLNSRRAAGGMSVRRSTSSSLSGETCSSACRIHGQTGFASAPQSRVRGWTALKSERRREGHES